MGVSRAQSSGVLCQVDRDAGRVGPGYRLCIVSEVTGYSF